MYGANRGVIALPATGVGTLAVGASAHNGGLLSLAVLLLAVWVLLMAGRTLLRLRPRREV